MNNMISLVINFILKLIGAKTRTDTSTPPQKPTATVPPPAPEPAPTPEPEPAPPPREEIRITDAMMQATLMLGHYDEGVEDAQLKEILTIYHQGISTVSDAVKLKKMRHGELFDWVKLKAINGKAVKTLQTFLVNIGIMHPDSNKDGIFAYATQAGVRLFQEYVRIYDNKNIIPTGIVDKATWQIIKEWNENDQTASKWPRGKKSQEFKQWMAMLKKAQDHYLENPHLITTKVSERIRELNQTSGARVDTFPLGDWSFDESDIHLIGIRRKEDAAGVGRTNDDVFVLLINGMVFKFWGSTDPNQKLDTDTRTFRKDEAFLSEGQHKFRFGWHNLTNLEKLYQALRPYERGVLVFRDDLQNDNRLTEADIEKGIDPEPNTTINIHWTGIGDGNRATWSAGCQVIAGKSYIDPSGVTRDCSAFAAAGSGDLQNNNEDHITRTKAAYNVFTDLLLLYRPKNVDYLIYTLGRDDTLAQDFLQELSGQELLDHTLAEFRMKRDDGNFA